MLKEIVNIILSSQRSIREGALFCENIIVDKKTKDCIEFLAEKNIVENTDYENEIGETVNLELSLARLNGIGYYLDTNSLILKNKYYYPSKLFYVADLQKFSDELHVIFYNNYLAVLGLMNSIRVISKHTYTDVDVKSSIIFREDKSLIIPLIYTDEEIYKLSQNDFDCIKIVMDVFNDSNSEKKILFINEIIDFLTPVSESLRFKTLLEDISEYTDKCHNSYQYYLRDFSYNKMKLELDSKALDFTQKVQAVINDSQTKLIAIPTAFVLVFSAFDFNDLKSVKDIISIISLFIFAIIIQIFLANQNSSLNFTKANILSYKETFSNNNIEKFNDRFKLVNIELEKQRNRLNFVAIVLWLIPLSLLVIWLFMIVANPKE